MKPPDWKAIASEVDEAFENGNVLKQDRTTLEKWLVGLSIGSHKYMTDQEPMIRKRDAIKHLVELRLTEEAERRREIQNNESSSEMRRFNTRTLIIALVALIVSAVSSVLQFISILPAE